MNRILAVLAFLVMAAGCGQKHEAVRRCVDENGNVAEDKNCANPPAGGPHRYAWVYAPSGAPKD